MNNVPIRVIRKKSPSLSPRIYSAFAPPIQWYLQSKEISLNLGMKWWNSAFNAQGSRVIIVVVQVGAVKIYVAAVHRRSGKRKHRMKLSLPPKSVEKPKFGSQLFLFVKFSFPVKRLMPYYAETGRSRPPNRLTLRITLLCEYLFPCRIMRVRSW
jgi:hypothetical protein